MRAHSFSPGELKQQIDAERRGDPFLVWRDRDGEQVILALGETDERVAIGREPGSGARVEGDPEVSRLHAELTRIGSDWTLADDGLSRNGSFVNGERAVGRRRLRDRDVIRVGNTELLFRDPREAGADETHAAPESSQAASLSETQRKVLLALCRPYKDGSAFSTPATNQAIAADLFLSVDAVKSHLRVLFEKFDVSDLPQNKKRAALVERAFRTGAVSPRELLEDTAQR